MTGPKWFSRPGVVLSCILLAVIATILLIPSPADGRGGNPRMTTRSADPLGTKLFYELAAKLGYTVSRADSWSAPKNPGSILVVFDPVVELEPTEVHEMLEHVRAGGSLLAVIGAGANRLSDSLHISANPVGGLVTLPAQNPSCQEQSLRATRSGLWIGAPMLFALRVPDSLRALTRTFTAVTQRVSPRSEDLSVVPATIGLPFGRGRIVIASDPDAFANDALRNCTYSLDLAAVAALGYLRDGAGVPRTTIVFDEYHVGRRMTSSSMRIAWRYLTETRSGNLLLQVCLAGFVLLLATSSRILPPRFDPVVERRSPLEHVDALARAYAQVGATRTGTQRLLRGLQRRVGGTRRATTRVGDEQFLDRIAVSLPETENDITVVRNALAKSVSPKDFAEVGRSVARIETALTKT